MTVFDRKTLVVQGFFNNDLYLDWGEGFHDIDECPLFHAFGMILQRAVGCHHHELGVGLPLAGRFQNIHSRRTGHAEIRKDQVIVGIIELGDCVFAVLGHVDAVLPGKGSLQRIPHQCFIISDQDAFFRHGHPVDEIMLLPSDPFGIDTIKVLPWPTSLLTPIFPRCASTIFRAIAKPKPVPFSFVVKNGVKS